MVRKRARARYNWMFACTDVCVHGCARMDARMPGCARMDARMACSLLTVVVGRVDEQVARAHRRQVLLARLLRLVPAANPQRPTATPNARRPAGAGHARARARERAREREASLSGACNAAHAHAREARHAVRAVHWPHPRAEGPSSACAVACRSAAAGTALPSAHAVASVSSGAACPALYVVRAGACGYALCGVAAWRTARGP